MNSQADWNNAMREVCEFGTVEDFWKYFSYVPRPRYRTRRGPV